MNKTEIYWLEQQAGDVPLSNEWLCEDEVAQLAAMRIPKRRRDWRLGRWTAKCAAAFYREMPCAEFRRIQVRPTSEGAPQLCINGKPAPLSISLSHREAVSMCAIGPEELQLGCDLERIEPHSEAFVSDYFTEREQRCIDAVSPPVRLRLVPLLWSAKESALKVLRTGLRADTRSVEVHCSPEFVQAVALATERGTWSPVQVLQENGRLFHGWWNVDEDRVRTILGSHESQPPVSLGEISPTAALYA